MIYDPKTNKLIDNLGWVDRGSLWVYSLENREATSIRVGDAGYLILRPGTDGYFAVVCGTDISVRHASEPETKLANISSLPSKTEFGGDSELWSKIDPCVRVEDVVGHSSFVRIDAEHKALMPLDLSWYTDGDYDLGYQGLVDCMTTPDLTRVIISVQRSSVLIAIDLARNQKIATIRLPGHTGSPKLTKRTKTDFIASDYDTLCRVRVDGTVAAHSILEKTGTFIGDYHLGEDGSLVVARPHSGDVLLLDSEEFAVLGSAAMPCQPLVPHRLPDGGVLARDWKTGAPHIGSF